MYVNSIDAEYPPFAFIGKSGNPDGLDIRAADGIAGEMGFQVKHLPIDWATIIPSLKAKKIDLIASGMSVTPERKTEVSFSIPIPMSHQNSSGSIRGLNFVTNPHNIFN